ncbi:MAG: hypothetical protein KatS3mg029_0866 [Saprospiraceae bacterium]|nr:MAG: hypothetical protein KatS3mg029_0866 [Saprospiraceae bacterium]
MKRMLFLFVAALLGFSASAQVKFKLGYDKSTDRYTVYVVSMQDYSHPQNITGTGQVTIKVPTNKFDPVDIVSHLEGMIWEANSRNNSPTEAPDFDYISFGLIIQGVAYPEYQKEKELPLFSFRNAYGCTGKVWLVDNDNDPFMPPNSQNANIGNTLTILGAGGDAYIGNVNGGLCDCADDGSGTTATEEELSFRGFRVFPNPVSDVANVQINWEGKTTDGWLQVLDALGRVVLAQPMTVLDGENHFRIEADKLVPGNYWIRLSGEDWQINLDSFKKQ